MARERNFSGHTRQEVIAQTLKTAAYEAVSLGEIISDGQMFDLEDEELLAFVRTVMLALLEGGARVVTQSLEKGGEWEALPGFDLPHGEAAEKVMQTWEAKGREAAFLVWFYRGDIV